MRVRLVAGAVELKVGHAQTRLFGLLRKAGLLRKSQAVRRALHRKVTDLTGIANRIEEVGRQRRLTAGKLDAHLTTRFDVDGVIQDSLDLIPGQLMDEADLVRIHEARITHHVAAVGQIDRHDRAASVLHRRGTMRTERRFDRREIATGKQVLDPLHELRINRHHIGTDTMLVAGLFHQDLAVPLDDVRLDLAGATIHQIGQFATT